MTILAVDISNGRTKLALAQGIRIISEVRTCPTPELTAERLAVLCADWSFDAAALCSVVPAAARAANAFLAARCHVLSLSPRMALPVDFSGYEGFATLGADRVANAVAAACCYPGESLVVIDAGTATTVDVVLPGAEPDSKPCFLGGAIAPGVGTMVRALQSSTAQLPAVPLSLPAHAVGRTTTEALQNGCVRGCRGLLRELVAGMEQECGCPLRPVLTGGDASLLAELMPELGAPESLLTLRGIALCAQANGKC